MAAHPTKSLRPPKNDPFYAMSAVASPPKPSPSKYIPPRSESAGRMTNGNRRFDYSPSQDYRERLSRNTSITCYRCGLVGHIMRNCPKNGNPQHSTTNNSGPLFIASSCIHDNTIQLQEGYINGTPCTVMRDSGCTTVGVRESLLKEEDYTGHIIECLTISGRTESFPAVEIDIDTPFFSGRVTACALPNPYADIILGNIDGIQERTTEEIDDWKTRHTLNSAPVRFGSRRKTYSRWCFIGKRMLLDTTPEEFASEQKNDGSLQPFFKLAASKQGNSPTFYSVIDGILHRHHEHKGDILTQVMIPLQHRRRMLEFAHGGSLAEHNSLTKTRYRLLSDCSWPGITEDLVCYVQSCDTCRERVVKEPLQLSTRVYRPFDRPHWRSAARRTRWCSDALSEREQRAHTQRKAWHSCCWRTPCYDDTVCC